MSGPQSPHRLLAQERQQQPLARCALFEEPVAPVG